MSISAEAYAETASGQPSAMWMHLAAEFMLQAVLEGYSLQPESLHYMIDDAFLWGAVSGSRQDPTEIDKLTSLFVDEESGREHREWTKVRNEYQAEVRIVVSHFNSSISKLVSAGACNVSQQANRSI